MYRAPHQPPLFDTPSTQASIINSLELHIPIPIPTPPAPLPIIIAYPLSASLPTQGSVNDSGLVLEAVPSETPAADVHALALEDDYEYVDVETKEDAMAGNRNRAAWEEKTNSLFSALNLPLNIHKLKIMRAMGKRPSPLLKLAFSARSGSSNSSNQSRNPKKKNESGDDGGRVRVEAECEAEMETVHGESWYLPSAKSLSKRRVEQQRSLQTEMPDQQGQGDDYVCSTDLAPGLRIIPSNSSCSSSIANTGELHALAVDMIPLPPTPKPMTAVIPASDPTARPLGYMYAPAQLLTRNASCKTCGSSPSLSISSTQTLAPSPGRTPVYAYDLLVPLTPAHSTQQLSQAVYAKLKQPMSASLTLVPLVGQYTF